MNFSDAKTLMELLKRSGQNGIDTNALKQAANGNPNELLNKLNPNDAQKLRQVLNDPELTKRLLNTKQAQELLRKLNSK